MQLAANNHAFALLIPMPRFNCINFHQNMPKILVVFAKKNTKFLSSEGSATRPTSAP